MALLQVQQDFHMIVSSQLLPQSWRLLFFAPAHFPRCWLSVFQVLIKVRKKFEYTSFASIASILSSVSSHEPDLCRNYRRLLEVGMPQTQEGTVVARIQRPGTFLTAINLKQGR